MRNIDAMDMFCGAGGTSQGLLMAANDLEANLTLVAINHWQVAIDTHSANHPYAQHLCAGIDSVDPRKLVPGGRLNVLCASPDSYTFSGNREDVVRQIGNAVPPNTARALICEVLA
jgi:DNA (cytosine-5)-methyltransferase 1